MIIKPEKPIFTSDINNLFGTEINPNRLIKTIVTNSKEASPDSLFIALNGNNSNGDLFIHEAKANGAITMSERKKDADVVVEGVSEALLKIASYCKKRAKSLKETIAITGSVGKTTTKNILEKMLSTVFKVHATKDNYNNYLGCSHTLITMPENSEILIVEAGMNHTGELSKISKAISPTISIITNIGTAHIGNLGSKPAIATAKLEILNGMKNKLLIAPYGEELLSNVKNKYTFSITDKSADSFIEILDISENGSRFNVHTKRFSLYDMKTEIAGKHILCAVAIAVSVFDVLGLEKETLKSAVNEISKARMRGDFKSIKDFIIFDDSYSSSPEAVSAVLNRLSLIKGTKSAVLGDMLELGEYSIELHESIGRKVAECEFKRLFAFGKYAESLSQGALNSGMHSEDIFINSDLSRPDITASDILNNCTPGEILLVKASHSVQIDRIIECIKKKDTEY